MQARNHEIAKMLRQIADLLKAQKANPFRRNAYLHAADTLDALPRDVAEIVATEGLQGLIALPAIGSGIARSIQEYLTTGRMSRLESLQGAADPVALFQSIPTVGPELARRIHDRLHVDSLEALESATRAGGLQRVEGLGQKRREAIEAWLATHLGKRQPPRRDTREGQAAPEVSLLLKLDEEYRRKASAGKLPRITPRRFNPQNRAWLPIMHATRKNWHFTVLYSNTARAHELKRIFDWVVIYYYDDHHQEGQGTVVTETRGELRGRRVVRGREAECLACYGESGKGR